MVEEQQKHSQQRVARPDAAACFPLSAVTISFLDMGALLAHILLKSHTIGTLGSERTFQLKSCVRNPTKTRDTAELVLKRFNFNVASSWKETKALQVQLFGFAGRGAHKCPLTCT